MNNNNEKSIFNEVYSEIRQLGIRDEKITNLQSSMKDRDRYYKRRLVRRRIVKYVVGAAVGVGAWYFLFKKVSSVYSYSLS